MTPIFLLNLNAIVLGEQAWWARLSWAILPPTGTLWLIEWCVRLLFAGVVISRRRAVPATLAWLVVVLFVPVLGPLLYLLVGENRLGLRRVREYELLTTQTEPLVVSRWWDRGLADDRVTRGFERTAHYATAVGGLPPLKGNRLELIADTDEFLARMVADIDGAQSHCHLLFYIWMKGGKAEEVGRALIRAAERGVECRVLVDSVGARPFLRSELRERMERAGVRVKEALPVGALRAFVSRIDLRNHRKVCVVDGRVAYAGSQNLADSSFSVSKRAGVGPWIDASVRMQGSAVQALSLVFLRDWALEVDEPVAIEERCFPRSSEELAAMNAGSTVQVVPTGPGPDSVAMREALLTTIYSASTELLITTPYFVPDDATQSALMAAARRGVRVTLVVPRRSDSLLVARASRWHFEDLLRSGVRILRFRDGLLHAKVLTVDGRFSMIGSSNIDMRSFWLNFEVTLMIYDEAFTRELNTLQERYARASDEIDLSGWKRRAWGERVVESFARLLGPLL